MALRPNATSFSPGATGGASQQSSSTTASKPSSFVNSTTPSAAPIATIPPNKTPLRPQPKTKGPVPRGNQGKRGQNQRKSEKKGRLTDEAVSADPVIESVMYGPANRRGQISLNHLLNFSIAPREYHYLSHPSTYRRPHSYGVGSGHHPADKVRFIQANHRFVVRPNGDYRAVSTDPDARIPWESILQILVSPQTHMMACPICLSEAPVVPRMARCGHIACLPCFIRYFASEDVATGLRGSSLKFRKCPICWDSIQLSEIKPVRWYTIDNGMSEENIVVASEPREGFDVAMRLFMRKPGTTLALPKDDYIPLSQLSVLPEDDAPWHYVPEILHYAWVVKGSGSYMHEQAKREIAELEQMEKEDEAAFGGDGFWTQKAIQRIRDILETYDDIGEGPARQVNLALSTAIRKSEASDPEDIPYQFRESIPTRQIQQREAPYLFYQPRSASHFYLAALDIRILRKAFGDFENFPSAILARVEHITSPQTIDDEFRRRSKYLAHLPSGCQVSFLECDWSEIVDPEVLTTFSSEIEKRRRLRREKFVREEKERENEERNRRFGRRGPGGFASYSEDDVLVGSQGAESEDVQWVIANAIASAKTGTSPVSLSTSPPGPSLSTPSGEPSGQRTVWGTPRVMPSIATPALLPCSREPVEDEDEPSEIGGIWAQNWEEMLKADRAEVLKNHRSRKKGRKLVLMSNSVQRGI